MVIKQVAISICLFLLSLFAACQRANPESLRTQAAEAQTKDPPATPQAQRNSSRVIHALVALCDNEHQGIVPVPARIGNGDDPANNLYWGAAFGVKSFFKKSSEWKLLDDLKNPTAGILERFVFKHASKDVYLIADAYRGREIKMCVSDFFEFTAGRKTETVSLKTRSKVHIGGSADLIAYVGHDGLMDFSFDSYPQKADDRRRDAIILACMSKRFFSDPLRKTGANPLLWTTGLMAPEAYVLEAALGGWVLNENGEQIRKRAATAYNQYQRCGANAASRLFATGW